MYGGQVGAMSGAEPRRASWFRVEDAERGRGGPPGRRRAGHARCSSATRSRRPRDRRHRAGQQPGQARRRGGAAGASGPRAATRPASSSSRIDSGPGMADLARVAAATGTPPPARWASGWARSRGWRPVRRATPCPGGAPCWSPRCGADAAPPPAWADGLTRPMTGETVCGDGYAVRDAPTAGGQVHGLRRARPRPAGRGRRADRGSASSDTAPDEPPADAGGALHRGLPHTRGAALPSPSSTPAPAVVRTSGSATSPAPCSPDDEPARHGVAARHRRAPRAASGSSSTRSAPESLVVMHSDGVATGGARRTIPGLQHAIAAGDRGDGAARRRRAPRRRRRARGQGRSHDRRRPAARWRCGVSRTSSPCGSAAARSPRRSAWSTRTRSGWPPRSARSAG